ncbi:MAG: hypothetical protein QF719_04360 [Chloroflexota bacterium]|nr:hypothetical protein [Chloroflexota bacterium]MDP6757430.1 hypothetical protein [Chloroflexota bacterium]
MNDLLNRRIPLWALAVLLIAVATLVVVALRLSPEPVVEAPIAAAPTAASEALPTPSTTPEPSPKPAPTTTAEPTSTATPAATPTATTTPAPTQTPSPTATPSPTPEPTPTPTATPIGGHLPATVGGIAFATDAHEVLDALASLPPSPPHFRPGERIFTAFRLQGATLGAVIRRVWYRDGEQVGTGESVVADPLEVMNGNVGERWGMPGGFYELVIWDEARPIASASFTVDLGELRLERVAFTREVDALGLPLESAHFFPPGTDRVLVSFQAFNMPTGSILEIERIVNGAPEQLEEFLWPPEYSSGPGSFQIMVMDLTPPGRPAEAGNHRVRISVDGAVMITDIVRIESGDDS